MYTSARVTGLASASTTSVTAAVTALVLTIASIATSTFGTIACNMSYFPALIALLPSTAAIGPSRCRAKSRLHPHRHQSWDNHGIYDQLDKESEVSVSGVVGDKKRHLEQI